MVVTSAKELGERNQNRPRPPDLCMLLILCLLEDNDDSITIIVAHLTCI